MKNSYILEEWLEKASHDLSAAKLLLKEKHYPDIIAFHIHQALEKYLKAYLIYLGLIPRKTHDLTKLLQEISAKDSSLKKHEDICLKVDEYYIEARYPLDSPQDYSYNELAQSLNETETIINIIKDKIHYKEQA